MRIEKFMEVDLYGDFDRKTLNQVVDLGYDILSPKEDLVVGMSSENIYSMTLMVAEDSGALYVPGGCTLENYIAGTVDDLTGLGNLTYCGTPFIIDESLHDEEATLYKIVKE